MDAYDQLKHLKAMTIRLGVLHEAQVLQLRNYPLLIPGVKTAKTHVDVDSKSVAWTCQTKNKKFRLTSSVKTWCVNIEKMVRVILWDETQIKIVINGRTIYGK